MLGVESSTLVPIRVNFFQASQFDFSGVGLVFVGINYHLQVSDSRPIVFRLNENADWRFRRPLRQAVDKRLLSMAAVTLKELKLRGYACTPKKQAGGGGQKPHACYLLTAGSTCFIAHPSFLVRARDDCNLKTILTTIWRARFSFSEALVIRRKVWS